MTTSVGLVSGRKDHSRDGQGRAGFTGEADAEVHRDQVQQDVAAYRDALYLWPVAEADHVAGHMIVHLGPAFRFGGEKAFSLKISPADLGAVREPVAVRQSDKDRLAPELRRVAAARTA